MNNALQSIDSEHGVYVYKEGRGHGHIGFDCAYERAEAVQAWCGTNEPLNLANVGKPEGYEEYLRIMLAGRAFARTTCSRCEAELSPQLLGKEGKRVEVIGRYGKKRRFYVGKSTGWIPIHLALARCDSRCGRAILGSPFKSVRILEPARPLIARRTKRAA